MKTCTGCGLAKPFTEFGKRAAMRDGHTSRCHACDAARARAQTIRDPSARAAAQKRYYDANRPARIAAAKAWNQAHQSHVTAGNRERRWLTDWMKHLVSHSRGAAKSRGREFTLTIDHIRSMFERQQGRCYWLRIPFAFELEARHPQRPSIDRLDPTRGYTPDNVVLACQFANMGRSILSEERFAAFLESSGLRERVTQLAKFG